MKRNWFVKQAWTGLMPIFKFTLRFSSMESSTVLRDGCTEYDAYRDLNEEVISCGSHELCVIIRHSHNRLWCRPDLIMGSSIMPRPK